MFFWRLIHRALRRQIGKRMMIAITIFLGASLTTSMFAVMFDVGDKIKQELGSYGANIQVLPQGVSVVSDLYETEDDVTAGALREDELPKLKTIFWAYNIENFAPFLDVSAEVGSDEVQIVGTWFNNHLDLPTGESTDVGITGLRDWWAIDGTWATDNQSEVMVGTRLASSMGWTLGDTITVTTDNGSVDETIVGIISSGSDEDTQIFASLADAQTLADRAGQVESIEVRALTTPDNDLSRKAARDPSTLSIKEWETWYCTAYVSSISYQIEEVMTNADAKAVRQIADTEGVILDKTQLIMTMVAIFAMVASALGIANLLSASVMERSKEIGLMKALGARNKTIVILLLTETFIVGLVGGLLGFAAGIGLAQLVGHLVFSASIAIRPIVAPIMALVIIATVLAGALPSIHYLLKLQPTQVLHGR